MLPKSSCGACATETGKIEQRLARGVFRMARRALGMQTRRPKEMPTKFRAHLKSGEVRFVSADQLPPALIFVNPLPPGLLSNRSAFTEQRMDVLFGQRPIIGQKTTPDHVHWERIELTIPFVTLTRALAKTAHAYAVATFGLEKLEWFLQTHILRGTRPAWEFVGGSHLDQNSIMPMDRMFFLDHRVVRLNNRDCVLVRVRLFAHVVSPTYQVIVGALQPDFQV